MSKRITITRDGKRGDRHAASDVPRREHDGLTSTNYETSKEVVVYPTFESMKLRPDLLKGIYNYGN